MQTPENKLSDYIEKYADLEKNELYKAFHAVRRNHRKETMLEDLAKIAALSKIMESRGLAVPGNNPEQAAAQAQTRAAIENMQTGPAWGQVAIGMIIMLVGIGLTVGSSGRAIFYGAILVGLFNIVKGLIGD